MKTLAKILAGLVTALMACAIGVFLLLLSREPAAADRAPLTPADIAEVRNLLTQTARQNPAPGSINTVTFTAFQLEQSANYLLQMRRAGNARVVIEDGIVSTTVSLPVLKAPAIWLNATLEFTGAGADGVQVESLKVGHLALPVEVARSILDALHQELMNEPDYARLVAAVQDVSVTDGKLSVRYQWQPALMGQLAARGRELVLEPGQEERLTAYAEELARLTRELGAPGKQSVTVLLAPMLRFAAQRGGDAAEENRAALQMLALYSINVDARRFLADNDVMGRMVRHDLRLAGRRDFAQHFLISAALAASAGSALASEIGVLKEEQDTQAGGSGFSFTDLAIDQAGTRVGQLAVADAARLQQLLGDRDLQEMLFTPAVEDLPEFLSKEEFAKRYGTVGSPAYDEVTRVITDRVSHLPLLTRMQQP